MSFMLRPHLRRLIPAAAFALLGIALPASATPVRISIESTAGAGDFDSNILGTLDPIVTPLSVADYYGYGTSTSFSDPSSILVNERTHVFFVQALEGLSVIFVHDNVAPFADPADGAASMRLVLTSDTADFLVRDDPVTDLFNVSAGGTVFNTQNNWQIGRTDGFAVGTLDGEWSLTAKFTSLSTHGAGGFVAYGDAGSTLTMTTDPPALNRRVRFQPIPEPASLVLLAGAIFMLPRRRPHH